MPFKDCCDILFYYTTQIVYWLNAMNKLGLEEKGLSQFLLCEEPQLPSDLILKVGILLLLSKELY
jgi:hypothetical protein